MEVSNDVPVVVSNEQTTTRCADNLVTIVELIQDFLLSKSLILSERMLEKEFRGPLAELGGRSEERPCRERVSY